MHLISTLYLRSKRAFIFPYFDILARALAVVMKFCAPCTYIQPFSIFAMSLYVNRMPYGANQNEREAPSNI
jgi:hypothetical protein